MYTGIPAPYQNSLRMYVAEQEADCQLKLHISHSHISVKQYNFFLVRRFDPVFMMNQQLWKIVNIILTINIKNDGY